jgi:hypothetical protein
MLGMYCRISSGIERWGQPGCTGLPVKDQDLEHAPLPMRLALLGDIADRPP